MQFKRYSNAGMQSTNFLDSVGKGIFMSVFFESKGVCNSNQALSRQCPSLYKKRITSFLIYVEICRMDSRHLIISAKSYKTEF